jgi:hypothetical protein
MSLEPRTPHRPEKLKKLSKNEFVFTLSIFRVNEKSQVATICVFNRVQPVHRRVTEFCALGIASFGKIRFPRNFAAASGTRMNRNTTEEFVARL